MFQRAMNSGRVGWGFAGFFFGNRQSEFINLKSAVGIRIFNAEAQRPQRIAEPCLCGEIEYLK